MLNFLIENFINLKTTSQLKPFQKIMTIFVLNRAKVKRILVLNKIKMMRIIGLNRTKMMRILV